MSTFFPGYLVAQDSRHPNNVLVCHACGDLNEVDDRSTPGACHSCYVKLNTKGPAGRGRCVCPHCGHENEYPRANEGPMQHRLFAIEYYNPHRKASHKGRFFKKPDAKDLARFAESERRWKETGARFRARRANSLRRRNRPPASLGLQPLSPDVQCPTAPRS